MKSILEKDIIYIEEDNKSYFKYAVIPAIVIAIVVALVLFIKINI